MEETLKQRLIEVALHYKKSIREFERSCSLSNDYLKSLRHRPGADKLSLILKAYPQLNHVWLLTGAGDGAPQPPPGFICYWPDIDVTGVGAELCEDTFTACTLALSVPDFRDCTDAVNIRGDSMAHPLQERPDNLPPRMGRELHRIRQRLPRHHTRRQPYGQALPPRLRAWHSPLRLREPRI